ncbi:hypothetical protein [Aurantiacibacter odishensis]|uniref:hypothetical protein n=1 Tax=Aurantiacibacter odishensis TaxID=1155476 RepID=UPI0013C4FB42|nr:hypothetical protein [Aurantiacibacter odishensis]
MEFVQHSRDKAAMLRAQADLAPAEADRISKLVAARKLEARAREVEIVIGPSGESAIADWLD